MGLLRNLVGVIGLLFVGLGFYSLVVGAMEWGDGLAFHFHAVDTVFADVFGDFYINTVGVDTRLALSDLPAFFVLSVLGVILAWYGLKPAKPKPKFRRP